MTEIGHFTTFSNLSTLSSYAPLRLAKAAIFGSTSSECRYGPGPIDGTDAADPRVSPICKPSGAILPVRMPFRVTRSRLPRSEEHTSELQSLMRISYAVFCLKKNKTNKANSELNTEITNN